MPMLVHQATRELNPALAVVAAARNIPRQLFLKHARSMAIVASSAGRAVAIAEEFDPAIQFTKTVQLGGHVGKL
jgi:hypothetical protein